MRQGAKIRRRRKEAGIALLIAIFILLLIGVVAIALVVSSGTESALAGNYRSSSSVYYAALAGVEEARARLRANNPNSFNNTAANFLPPPGTALAPCAPVYVLNPLGGEAVTPWDSVNVYYDAEFAKEFGASCPAPLPPSPSPKTASVWNLPPLNGLAFPGPLYKWVRINGVSEQSLNIDADADGRAQSTTPLYYDATNRVFSNNPGAGPQALELTALAVLPNNSQKLLQYLVAPEPITLPPFLAALTLSGSNGPLGNPTFQAPANNAAYSISGVDQCNGNPTGVYAIGLFGDYSGGNYSPDKTQIIGGIPIAAGGPPPVNTQPNYTGSIAAPAVDYLTAYPANMESPAQLDSVVQLITQNADAILPSGPVNYPLPTVPASSLNSLGMSSTNPMTVVINGNLNATNWTGTGYGTLVVIGAFTYDPATTWNGIVLVIGQGQINNTDIGQFQTMSGAVFVAKTRDASGNLLGGKIGGASVSFSAAMQGNGIRYNSCWIQKAQPTSGYKILSFHEISQ